LPGEREKKEVELLTQYRTNVLLSSKKDTIVIRQRTPGGKKHVVERCKAISSKVRLAVKPAIEVFPQEMPAFENPLRWAFTSAILTADNIAPRRRTVA